MRSRLGLILAQLGEITQYSILFQNLVASSNELVHLVFALSPLRGGDRDSSQTWRLRRRRECRDGGANLGCSRVYMAARLHHTAAGQLPGLLQPNLGFPDPFRLGDRS